MATSLNTIPANQRIELLKTGKRNFLTSIKLPPNPETRWLIEAVCLNYTPISLPEGSSILDQANHYLMTTLYNFEAQLNQDRNDWVQNMKS